MNSGEKIKKIRKSIYNEIKEIFRDTISDEESFYLAAYMTSATCCFNRYRCFVEMDDKTRDEIGRRRETKYVAVLCERKLFKMECKPEFELCMALSRKIFDLYAEEVVTVFMESFGNEFKEDYILKLAEQISYVNTGGAEANYESAWSLISVLNNIEKNNEIWEFWHIHGIMKEKINYFNRAAVFEDEKISILSESAEFWDLICRAMEVYREATDIIIWVANNDLD